MTRAAVGAVVAIALTAALAIRLARLDARPMHHDEANQAVKFATLLERGEYRYDAHDHHGPTLYYLSLPAAWLRGQFTLASLDERTVRLNSMLGEADVVISPADTGYDLEVADAFYRALAEVLGGRTSADDAATQLASQVE